MFFTEHNSRRKAREFCEVENNFGVRLDRGWLSKKEGALARVEPSEQGSRVLMLERIPSRDVGGLPLKRGFQR